MRVDYYEKGGEMKTIKAHLLWISICLGVIVLMMFLSRPSKKCLQWEYQEQMPIVGISLGINFDSNGRISKPELKPFMVQLPPKQVCIKEE